MKLAFLGAAAVFLTGPSEPAAYFVNLDLVHKIVCDTGEGQVIGTGSQIDSDLMITAWHVVAHGDCSIDSAPVANVFHDAVQDVAVVRTSVKSEERMNWGCQEAVRGAEYFGIGFPLGANFAIQRYIGTGAYRGSGPWKGEAIFRGVAIPGMSGGPVVDANGTMIGVLTAANAKGEMLARPLSQTWMCAGAKS